MDTVDPIEARLDELERESRARRDELQSIARALPAATSRRAYLVSMARGIVRAPDRGEVARRVGRKVLRTPLDLIRARRR